MAFKRIGDKWLAIGIVLALLTLRLLGVLS